MILSASSAATNIFVTVFIALFVLLLPYFDRRICARLGVNPGHKIRSNGREGRLLRLRWLILFGVFCCYMAANVYLVFFSRSASREYMVHVAPLNDLRQSVQIDMGILGLLSEIYTQGLSEGISHIHVEKVEDITQVYMNVMLYVPMGYMLPYLFSWCRTRVRTRTTLCCFVVSFITENFQLVFKRGFYDIDDLLSNTFGGWVGSLLFVAFAYIAANPNWREDLRGYRRWKFHSRRSIYPLAAKNGVTRATIIVSDPAVIEDFYIGYLGFRPISQIEDEASGDIGCLLQMGSLQLEIVSFGAERSKGTQYLTISVRNINRVRNRLAHMGTKVSAHDDPYTGLKRITIRGPENVFVSFIES